MRRLVIVGLMTGGVRARPRTGDALLDCTAPGKWLLALALLVGACSSSTEPKAPHDVTGFWSGTTTYSTDPSCSLLSCAFNSRMMVFQTGTTVEGWYRARASIPGDEVAFVGSVHGDTLSLLINSAQVNFVGAMKFRILAGGDSLEATNNGNILRFGRER